MARFLLHYVLPLILPFVIYFGFVALTRGRAASRLDETPWLILAGLGVVLVAASLLTWSFLSGSPTDRAYVPPRFEDGRVVPAQTVDER